MFNGVLRNLVTNTADDVAASAARKAMGKSVLSTIIPEERILQRAPEGLKIPAAAAQYLDNPQLPAPQVPEAAKKYLNPQPTAMVDRYNVPYVESNVPVKQLLRKQDYQPRVTASGRGTENSVYTKGYNEGAVDQPMLVRKNGDMYEVLGGHSRTLGMERRAAEGLPNPEAIKARIYENITDEQAKQIARAANQGGQYESTLDMAKSISDSLKEQVAPSVQKQNMTRGFGYDDYDYLWQTVQEDGLLREKLFQGALSQDDVLAVARHARQKGLEPQKAMGIITSLDKNGSFNKQNAKNVINLLTGKTNAGLQRDAQTGLFGDIGTAVNSVDLLKDFEKTSAELTRRVNAVKTVTGEAGLSDDVLRELDTTKQEIERKMKNITDEIMRRYKAKQPAAIPQVLDIPDTPLEGQADIFGNVADQAPAPAAPVKQRTITEAEQSKAPRKISVLKITDNTDDYNIPVSAKKYLPPIKTPVSQPAKPVAAVQAEIAALSKALPDQAELRKMTDQQIEEYAPSWREAMASILAIQATMGAEERQ